MGGALFAIPYVGPVLSFAWACLQAAARIANAIPGAVWACGLVVVLWCWWDAAGDRDEARTELAELVQAVDQQKEEAALQLAAETAAVQRLTDALAAVLQEQEGTDAKNQQTIAQLRDDLRRRSRAAGGPGLRDPWAAGCGGGGGGAEGAAAAASQPGAQHPAEAGRLLSAQLEGLLLERFEEADAINAAYASCRADTLNLRRLYGAGPAPAAAEPPD